VAIQGVALIDLNTHVISRRGLAVLPAICALAAVQIKAILTRATVAAVVLRAPVDRLAGMRIGESAIGLTRLFKLAFTSWQAIEVVAGSTNEAKLMSVLAAGLQRCVTTLDWQSQRRIAGSLPFAV
jgi:hypothetical protein